MKLLILISYILSVVFGILIYSYHFYKIKIKKRSIGTIYYRWSSKFNLSFTINLLRLAILFAYLIWIIYQIITEPYRNHSHIGIMLLIIILSFYPRWNIIIGAKGIILGMKVIPWKNIRSWEILDKRKIKYLEFEWALDSMPTEIKTKRIKVPLKVMNNLNKIINKGSH